MTAPARSVFAEPLAQARQKLGWLIGLDWDDDTDVQKYARETLASLDLIEQRASELEERVLLDLAQEMFPDFDFSGCYDADDLRQHLKGQVSSAIEQRATDIEKALAWYAERRNYVPAAPPSVKPPKHLMDTDAWDGEGPGARARAALSAREEAS